MSGFGGVFNRDGRPIDRTVVAALLETIRYRGPDAQCEWTAGAIGLCHTLFRTDALRNGCPQPSHFAGLTLVGDVRLDAREDLINSLGGPGTLPANLSDADLVLRAFHASRDECTSRLKGDFSFAIWDAVEETLFCARDPFGVKPFFYVQTGGAFVFSNTMAFVCAYPGFDSRADESWIADDVLFGFSRDTGASVYANVRRIRPGTRLLVSKGRIAESSYWTLSVGPQLRYRRQAEYVEHFTEILCKAIKDRQGSGPVALQLSGGLDSGILGAALAGRLDGKAALSVKAFCVDWSRAFFDPEPAWARRSASQLQLELEMVEQVPLDPFEGESGKWAAPEPTGDWFRPADIRTLSEIRRHAPVLMHGEGGDELQVQEIVLAELRHTRSLAPAFDAVLAWLTVGRPALGLRWLADRIARRQEHGPITFDVPPWIDEAWAKEMSLADRVAQMNASFSQDLKLPRANSRKRLSSPLWPQLVERFDAGFSQVVLDTTWPYLDHRVIDFSLRLPAFPWCMDKFLSRTVLKGILPSDIVERPKTPLMGNPVISHMETHPDWPIRLTTLAEALGPRVSRTKLLVAAQEIRPREELVRVWQLLRTGRLASWLGRLSATATLPEFR